MRLGAEDDRERRTEARERRRAVKDGERAEEKRSRSRAGVADGIDG